MATDRSEWTRLIASRIDPTDAPLIELPIKPSPRGGSGTFLAADHDGDRWWVKPLNNKQGERVTITEAAVGMAGRLISAPVCEMAIVHLPPEIEGWEFRPGSMIRSGFAHGARDVAGAQEDRSLLYRERDENTKRHAGVVALYDWCWGGDDQWLYAEPLDREIYSHDHGWYLPETGPSWSETTLAARVDEPHQCRWSTEGLNGEEVTRLATVLRNLSRSDIGIFASAAAISWPVTNSELEVLGWFLERRAPQVADRLDASGGAP